MSRLCFYFEALLSFVLSYFIIIKDRQDLHRSTGNPKNNNCNNQRDGNVETENLDKN